MYFDDQSKRYIILDIEGNSASRVEERKITQFSAIIVENGEKKEVNMMNRNVNYINPVVSKMTHISIQKCKVEGYTERHMVNEIHHILSSCNLIYAYGCDFDKNIINIMFNKYKLPRLDIPWVDVINDVKTYLKPSKNKLSIAASEFGFESNDFHNALTDCYATLHLMEAIEDIRRLTE